MFVNYFILTGKPKYLKFVEDTDRAHISTIHSFTLDILRNEFSILDLELISEYLQMNT